MTSERGHPSHEHWDSGHLGYRPAWTVTLQWTLVETVVYNNAFNWEGPSGGWVYDPTSGTY